MRKLEADGIEFSYNSLKQTISGVYIKLEQGKVTGLLGRNGSGKSTLLQIMYGMLPCKLQSVRVDGKRLSYFSKKRNISYLPQYHFIPNEYKVKTILQDFGKSIQEAEEFLQHKFDSNQRFSMLSGGEKRLLEIFFGSRF